MIHYFTRPRKLNVFFTALLLLGSMALTMHVKAQCTINTFPYLESFSNSGLPSCWAATSNGGAHNWVGTASDGNGASGPQSGSGFMYLYVFLDQSSGNPYNVTSPSVALGATPKQLSYYYFLGSGGYTVAPVPLTVQISTNAGTTWTTLYQHTSSNSVFTGTSNTNWTQNVIDLSAYANDTIQIKFVGNSNYGNGVCDIGIDEFLIQTPPTCFPPTALSAANITSSGATFSWTAPTQGAGGYNYEIRTSGAGGSGATGLAASDSTTNTSDTVTSLSPSTTYYLYIQSNCGATNGVSTWAGPIAFTTQCVAITSLPWSEGFEGLATVGNNILPNCWSHINTTTTYTNVNYSCAANCNSNVADSGTHFIGGSWYFDVWDFTPGFQLTAGVSYNYSFWFKTADATPGYIVSSAVGSSQTIGAMTTVLGTITNANASSYTQVTYTFTPTTSGVYYFGLHDYCPTSAPNGIGFDNFRLDLTPPCSLAPTALSTPDLEGIYSTISWTAPQQGATGYNWEVRTSGAAGSGATGLVASDSTTQTLDTATGLTPLTTYQLYVQASCGSPWGGPYTFTTSYAPCAGTPTAGTAVTLSAGVCSATLALTGTTTGASGLQYQWQERYPVGTGSFTNIGGATHDTSTILLPGVSAEFRCVLICTSGGASDTSSIDTVTASPGTVGGFSPIAVTGFNQDVIANGNNNHTANPPSLSTTTTVDAPNGYYFYDASYSFNGTTFPATSLPVNGQVVSNSITGLLYQLQSATASNVLQLRGGTGVGSTLTGTLTLTTPQSGTEVYLLGVSGNGASTITAVVHFTDGTSQTFTGITVKDWFNGTPYSQGGFGRVNSTGFDAGAPGGNNPRMYDLPLALAPVNYSKLVQSITVTNTSAGAAAGSDIVNIFAVTMAVPDPASFCGGLATSVSLFNYAASGVTYQWQSSTTTGGPYTNVTSGTGATTTTYTNTSTGSIYYVVQGTCTATGLTAPSNEVNVNINPAVTVSVTPTTANYCAGGTGVTISAISTPGNQYSWSPAAGLSTTRDSSVVAAPSATTTYTVTAFNSGGCSSTASAVINYIVAPVVSQISATPSSLCAGGTSQLNVVASVPIAYCVPTISNTYLHYLGGFNLTDTTLATTYVTTTNNFSPGTVNNYTDHGTAATTGTLTAGTKYSFSATAGGAYEGLAVWIDYNQNGIFDNNELIYAKYGGSGTAGYLFTDSFIIPSTALNGVTKLRVRDNWAGDTTAGTGVISCRPGNTDGFSTYGETDDYTITITGGVPSTGLTYAWTPSATLTGATTATPVSTPANGITTYTVTVSNGICSVIDSVSDTAGVALAIAPTAVTGASAPYCSGSTTFNLSANRTGGGAPFVYTWTSAPAGFTSSSPTATVTPDTTTTYYLTVTDSCGSTVTDSVTATVIKTPVIAVTPLTSTYCLGGVGTMLTVSGATSYSWSPSSSLNSSTGDTVLASPSSTTSYSVTGTSQGCSAVAYANVNVVSAPIISLIEATPPSPSICAGHHSQLEVIASTPYTYCVPSISNTFQHYLASFYLTDTTNTNTYISTSNAFSPGTPNNYVDHGTAASTGSLTAGTNYDFNGAYGGIYEGVAVWIDFNQNGVFDNNELLYAAYGGSGTAGTPFNGVINVPSTAFSGTTKMRVRLGWGSDTIPDANGLYSCSPGKSDGFSTYGETDDYTVTITGGAVPTALNYSWSPAGSLDNAGIATPIATPSVTTGYTVTVTDPNTGCSATQTDTVTIATPVPLTDSVSGPTTTLCAGVRSVLNVSASGGCPPYTFAWSAGAGVLNTTIDTVHPIATTTYTVTVTDSSGTQLTSTYTIHVVNPLVTATTGDTVCGIPANVLLTATPDSGATIVWYNAASGGTIVATGDTFRTPSISTSTTYYAFATTASPVCTSATGTAVIATVHANPTLTLNANIIHTCNGTAQPLTITSTLPAHGSYVWTPIAGLYTNAAGTTAYTGGNASSLYGLPTSSTSYTVTLYDSTTGCSSSSADSFSLYARPTANLTGNDTVICPGAILTESIVFTGTGPWIFNRTNDRGGVINATATTSPYTFTDTPSVSGPIKVTTLSDAHCSARYSDLDSINVTVNAITAAFTESASYIHLGDSITFTNTSAGAVSYSWTFGDGGTSTVADPSHKYAAIGIYTTTLTVINANDCSSTISKQDTVTFPLGISDNIAADANDLKIFSYENKVMVDFSQFKSVDAMIEIYNVLGQALSNDEFHSPATYTKALDLEAAYVIVRVKMADGSMTAKKLFIHK